MELCELSVTVVRPSRSSVPFIFCVIYHFPYTLIYNVLRTDEREQCPASFSKFP